MNMLPARSTSLRTACTSAWLVAVLCSMLGHLGAAQDRAGGRLLDQDPFDQITLDAANDNAVIKVQPIRFPGGKVPDKPKPGDKMTVKLLDTGRDYEVAWRHIVKVELFQDMLVTELQRLSAQGHHDEAYEYLLHLRSNYPQAAGLDAAHNAFLYQSAGGAFRQGKFAEALGILEELHRRSPRYQPSADGSTFIQILGSAAEKLIGEYVAKEDYRSARSLLERLTKQYSAASEPFAQKWRTQLSEEAATHRDAARAALEANEYVSAYDSFARMSDIWPQVEGGPELAAEMAERYPLVKVGVLAPALAHDSRSLANPAASRAGRLLRRQLFEYQGMGPEGGRYLCPFGETEISDDGSQLTFRLKPGPGGANGTPSPRTPLNGYELSQYLLPTASTSAKPGELALRQLIESVQVSKVTQVAVNFRHPHLLPQAVLQDVLESAGDELPESGPFRPLPPTDNITRYVANQIASSSGRGQLAEVVERAYDDPQRALVALGGGEIDVLERIFPGDVATLKQDRAIAVDTYGVPTTHLLVVRRHNPYLANRTFRRALLYGSDRETILRETLLKGASPTGYRVISAPFPAPTGSGDTIAYAYDQSIQPRPYDARLALTLRILGQREVKAVFDKRESKTPPLAKFTLAHPADEVAKIACRALAVQWKAIGIQVELVELPLGVFVDPEQKHDLLYVQARIVEPLVDAARLLGPGGLAATDNSFIQLCLRQIDSAPNWSQARQHFQELHRLLHEDVTVAPLWQTYDHFAYRRSVQGVGQHPVSLYQHVEKWRLAPQTTGNR